VTIERSHGKARPTLPRASDLTVPPVADADAERTRQRDGAGRFASGNIIGQGRGWKRAVAKLLGRASEDPVSAAVAADAWRLYSAKLRELPNDGPTVRGLAAQGAREESLAGFWHAEAAARGLATPEGMAASDRAMRHGQRAERLAVTTLDVSTKLAAARPKADSSALAWLVAPASAPVAPTASTSTHDPNSGAAVAPPTGDPE
jgi:hypothetical protein